MHYEKVQLRRIQDTDLKFLTIIQAYLADNYGTDSGRFDDRNECLTIV